MRTLRFSATLTIVYFRLVLSLSQPNSWPVSRIFLLANALGLWTIIPDRS